MDVAIASVAAIAAFSVLAFGVAALAREVGRLNEEVSRFVLDVSPLTDRLQEEIREARSRIRGLAAR